MLKWPRRAKLAEFVEMAGYQSRQFMELVKPDHFYAVQFICHLERSLETSTLTIVHERHKSAAATTAKEVWPSDERHAKVKAQI